MADVWEKDLAQKSSLTTSDFVRVVGSDNVSYKQPMTDLMTTTGIARTWITTGVDLNTLTPNATSGNGYYRGNDISAMTNRPSAEINSFPWALDAINVNGYIKQILHVYTAQANIVVYERIQRYSSGSTIWGNWEKMPTRTEIDANFKLIAGIPASNNISSNDNLNDYTSLGSYACTSGSIATTLANCPVTGAFRLDVSYGTYNAYVIQDLTPMVDVTNIHWRRTRVSGTWGAWTQMPTRAEVDAVTTVSQSTLTKVKADLTFGSQNRVYRYGRIVFVTVVFSTSTNASQNDVLFTTPHGIRYPVVANIRNDNGSIYLIGTDEELTSNIKALYGSGLPAGVYRGTFTYLATA